MALTRTAKRRLQQGPAPGTDSKRPRLQSVELTDSDDDDVESRDAINEEVRWLAGCMPLKARVYS